MSDDSSGGGEKTEQPTDKKIRDSREKGQVAQSKELTSISSLATIVFALIFAYSYFFDAFSNNTFSIFQDISENHTDLYILAQNAFATLSITLKIILIPIILAAILSLIVNIIQINGIVLSKEFFKFDMNRLNPVTNFKNIFSLKNFIKFARQAIEMTAMAAVGIYIFKKAMVDVLQAPLITTGNISVLIALLIGKIFVILFFMHLAFSIFDFVMEKRNMTKQLMMSMHELKEEFKNTEGNPEIKHKRKELHRELLEDGGFGAVANSTFVVANPTHIAILMRYSPKKMPLPIIIGKARGEKALEIFQAAKRLKVPILRDKWIARQLYDIGEIGKPISSSMLKYVSDLIGRNLHQMPQLIQEIMSMKPSPVAKPMAVKPTTTVVNPARKTNVRDITV